MRHSRIRALLEGDPVVVTGTGAVSVAGAGTDALWRAVEARRPGARAVELAVAGGGTRTVAGCPAEVPGSDDAAVARTMRRLDRSGQYALAAGLEAAAAAGFCGGGNRPDPERFGAIVGSSRGPKGKWGDVRVLLDAGGRVKPTLAATTTLAAAAGALAQATGALGPSWLVSSACASGAHAIALAAEQIALGNADAMLAGGADEALDEAVIAGLAAAGVLARGDGPPSGWCRPFARDRNGFVPGSGAGMLALESLSSARRRGVRPLAVLAGWSLLFAPSGLAGIAAGGDGLRRTMRAALDLAGAGPHDVGYLNAHGTGTQANDAAEAAAILAAFDGRPPPCSSTKPVTGHCLGATPAMEAVVCVEALRRRALPPSIPVDDPDPAFALPFSAGGPAPDLRCALSNSAAFWGFQATLVFERPPEA